MAFKQQTQMLDFFEENGVTMWNIAALNRQTGKMKGDARPRDRAEAEKCMGWCWHENMRGADVFIRPARWLPAGEPAAWPIVFLDDVSGEQAAAITARGRALVVQTSPGRHHIWLATDKALTEAERTAVQRLLVQRYGGDPGSVSGDHFGRLAGYKNVKRGGCWINIVATAASRPPLPVAPLLDAPAPPRPGGHPIPSPPAGGRARVLYDALGGSESEREFGYIIGRLRWLKSADPSRLPTEAERLTAQLAQRAMARGKRKSKHEAYMYATRTVSQALRRI